MLALFRVAVTGGLSCGKSSVCRFFQELGAQVVSADTIVHRFLSLEHPLGRRLAELLGTEVVRGGIIDRAAMAAKVFDNRPLLQQVEEILHPAVYDAIESASRDAEQGPNPPLLFVAEVPLLFESDGARHFDVTVVVTCEEALCRRRFEASTSYGGGEYDRRMARQLSPRDKAAKADYVIANDGDISRLRNGVEALFHLLTKA